MEVIYSLMQSFSVFPSVDSENERVDVTAGDIIESAKDLPD